MIRTWALIPFQTLQHLIGNPSVPADNKLRLTAIYALRYAKHNSNATPMLLDLLAATTTLSHHRIQLIPKLIRYHNSLQAAAPGATGIPDLFQPSSLFGATRDRFRGLKGVENVYTQHSPRLEATLQDLIRGKLRQDTYPFVDSAAAVGTATAAATAMRDKPQDIIVFMVGGTTYEEARTVAQVNASSPGIRVVLGGTTVLNSASFLGDVEQGVGAWPAERAADAGGRLRQEVGR